MNLISKIWISILDITATTSLISSLLLTYSHYPLWNGYVLYIFSVCLLIYKYTILDDINK